MTTRERILNAAVEEFIERDESGFRVSRVAKQVGCATSVLYHHFGSRAGLVDAALIELVERLAQADEAWSEQLADAARSAESLSTFLRFSKDLSTIEQRRNERSVDARVRGAAETRESVRTVLVDLEDRRRAGRATMVSILRERGLLRADVDAVVVLLAFDGIEERWRQGDEGPLDSLAAALGA